MSEARRIPIAAVEQWTTSLLEFAGMPNTDARDVAKVIVRTEARGIVTHGLSRLPSYVEKLQSGEYNPAPNIEISERAGAIRLDGDGAMGQLAGLRATDECVKRAEDQAIVLCFGRDLGHLGAVGLFPLLAAERGFISIAIQRTPPILALPGAAGPLIGHNPIAFAAPLEGSAPIVFDMACSVAARGHILLAAERGEDIPQGWAVTAEGEPTTDAKAAREGMLLPFGGYKGLGIAMLGELLAGCLAANFEDRDRMKVSPNRFGAGALGGQTAFFCVINPMLITESATYATLMHDWTQNFLRNAGAGGQLPGLRSAQLETTAATEGLPIQEDLLHRLRSIGQPANLQLI